MTSVEKGRAPDFISIGLQKTGSNWLYSNLNRHAGIEPASRKGYEYFYYHYLKNSYQNLAWTKLTYRLTKEFLSREVRLLPLHLKFLLRQKSKDLTPHWKALIRSRRRYYFSSKRDQTWYEQFFPVNGKVMGDISCNYGRMDEHTIEQIKSTYPDLKVILILREPCDRYLAYLRSQFRGARITKRKIQKTIDKTMALEPSVRPIDIYNRWAKHFDKDHLFVGYFDDIRDNPVETYKSICRFLNLSDELDQNYLFEARRYGSIKYLLGMRGNYNGVDKSPESYLSKKVNSTKYVSIDYDPSLISQLRKLHFEGIEELATQTGDAAPRKWLEDYAQTN